MRVLRWTVPVVAVVVGAVTWLGDDRGERDTQHLKLAGGGSGPAVSPGSYERLSIRSAPGGLTLRLYGDGWSRPLPEPSDRFALCEERNLVLEVSSDAVAQQLWFPAFTPSGSLSLVGTQEIGVAEGAPAWVAVVRVTDDVALVRGAGDEAAPSDGYAVLGGDGPLPRDEPLEAIAGDRAVGQLTLGEPPTRCYAPGSEPAMPEPGPGPDDPEGAEAEVRAAYRAAFDHRADADERETAVAHLSDLQSLFDRAAQSFPEAVASITVEVREVVFTSPDAAAVRFELFYEGGAQFGEQIGHAVVVDDTWRVRRDTMCMVLGWAGVQCPDR